MRTGAAIQNVTVIYFIKILGLYLLHKKIHMKKIIPGIFLLFSALWLNAQTFYTEDFASGIPAGWTNVDNSGNNVLWRTTTSGSVNTNVVVDTVLNQLGTTASNGYLIMDSDSAGQGLTEDAVLTTTAINCSGHGSVHLAFNEYFAQYLASTGVVSVSNNNINWTDVHTAHAGLGLNQGTPNPNYVEVDITSIAANQATVYVRFEYQGEWDYWWFIDDLQMIEPPAVDVGVVSIEKLNDEYTLIPYAQATALSLSADVINNGSGASGGGSALFEVIDIGNANTVYSENISLPSIAPGATQNVMPAAPFIPTSPGNYKSRITLSVPGDPNATNDMMESPALQLSDTIYARDDDNFAGTQGIGVGPGEDAIVGQNFRVNNTDQLTSITFFLDDGFGAQVSGTPVYFTVHPQQNDSVGPDGATVLATSDTLLVTPGMIPSGGAYYTLNLHGGALNLNPGLYFIGIHEVDSILTIGYSNAVYTPGAVWVHWNSIPSPPAVAGWAHAEDFTIEVAYMIRANFGYNPNGISENRANDLFSIYPNPSSGEIFLVPQGNHANEIFKVRVFNSLGMQNYESEWNGSRVSTVDLSGFHPGIYTVMVTSNDKYFSRKVIIAY